MSKVKPLTPGVLKFILMSGYRALPSLAASRMALPKHLIRRLLVLPDDVGPKVLLLAAAQTKLLGGPVSIFDDCAPWRPLCSSLPTANTQISASLGSAFLALSGLSSDHRPASA